MSGIHYHWHQRARSVGSGKSCFNSNRYKKLTLGASVTKTGWLPPTRCSNLFSFSLSQLACLWSPQFPKALVLTEELRPLKKAGPAPPGTALAPRLSTPVPQMALGRKSQEELNIYPMDCPVRLVQVGIAGKDIQPWWNSAIPSFHL